MRKQAEIAEYAEIILSTPFLEFPHFFRSFCILPQLVFLMRKQAEIAEYAEIISSTSFLMFPHFFRSFCIFPQYR